MRRGFLGAICVGLALTAVGIAQAARTGPTPQAAQVELGRRLFYDADLSRDGTMACATCHRQIHAFTETNPTHPGVTNEPGKRNAMTLANVGAFTSLTWGNPLVRTLEAQAAIPVFGTDPVEMGMHGMEGDLVARLARDRCYRTMFREAFPEAPNGITIPKTVSAIAAFQRTLISRDTPYDHGALTPAATRGKALFFSERLNCAACHAGPLFTDAAMPGPTPIAAFHNIGAADDGGPRRDYGLSEISGDPGHAGRFRTPTLRNVALTAPYLHDGSVRTLSEAIRAHVQRDPLKRPLADHRLSADAVTDAEMPDLVAFLESLSDEAFTRDPRFALPMRACGRPL
jgi:cytochrome c peroxidase